MAAKPIQKKSLWRELSKEYFDLTHLHGFKELSLSEHLVEKIFWLTIIIAAFAFTGYLIFRSVTDALDDKKQTFVKYDKYGNISLPILYCPSRWIDLKKADRENISRSNLVYALSFLRTNSKTYLDENRYHEQDYLVNVTPESFCNNEDKEELPELVYMVAFVETYCFQQTNIPEYFGVRAKKLLKKMEKIMLTVSTTNVKLMKAVFEKCLQQKTDEIWLILYNNFYLSITVEKKLKPMLDSELMSKVKECEKNSFAIYVTLNETDNLKSDQQNLKCQNRSYPEFRTNVSLCSIYNDLTMFYMYHGEATRSVVCSNCIEMHAERKRSQKLAEFIGDDPKYSQYLKRTNKSNTFESFKDFINVDIGGSDGQQTRKILELRKQVVQQFEVNEKNEFQKFLDGHNGSVFEVLKKVSCDENKFLLGMSVDPVYEIRPRIGEITVEKVTNAYGVCYLFQVTAAMEPLTKLPYVINEVDQWRRINQKLFINVVELDVLKDLAVRNDDNILVVGSSSYDLVPSQNWFKISLTEDQNSEPKRNRIEILNLVYQSKCGFETCAERTRNERNVSYTYNNCLMDCFNQYTQPKYIGGDINKAVSCQYIMESFSGDNVNYACSVFANSSAGVNDSQNDSALKECQEKCVVDCDAMNFEAKYSMPEEEKIMTPRLGSVYMYEDETLPMIKNYMNLPLNGTTSKPIWMKPFETVNDPTIADMIYGIRRTVAQPIALIEIQVDSGVTTYVTTEALQWYDYLGVVGGQVNLIVSGSLITLFQLIWWLSRYCYQGWSQ